jgi:3',5'-cyclic AMP phosphodiesterase CpdA
MAGRDGVAMDDAVYSHNDDPNADDTGPGRRVIPALGRSYTDGLNGETVWTYHAEIGGLRPGTSYSYAVTAANDAAAAPLRATVRTAPAGRVPFRFTSFGDLATPNTNWVLSYGQSAYAVQAVESFQPLFHLLNGDLCYADLNPSVQPEVWRDFGNNNQASAANRPWMPCPGNHEIEFDNGPQGFTSYLTRYLLPDNGVPGFRGYWYSFRVGPAALTPAAGTGNPAIPAGTSFYIRGYSQGAQTAWLRRTLAAARADRTVDWIIVQMHQDSCSSSATGNGSDLGIREEWLPLFDEYQVDLVLCGHDHDYERSFPVRGYDSMVGHEVSTGAPVQTRRPHPVTTTAADAVEDATWSAMRDPATGYGIGVFDLDPGEPGGDTTITVTYYHAAGADPTNPNTGVAGTPSPDYTKFETFTLFRPRSDRHG